MSLLIGGLFFILVGVYSLNRLNQRWERIKQQYEQDGLEVKWTAAWEKRQKKENKFEIVLGAFLFVYGLLLNFGPSQIVAFLKLEFLPHRLIGIIPGACLAVWGLARIVFSEKAWELQKKWSKMEFLTEGVPKNWLSNSVLFGGLALLFGLAILFFSIASLG